MCYNIMYATKDDPAERVMRPLTDPDKWLHGLIQVLTPIGVIQRQYSTTSVSTILWWRALGLR